MGWEVIRAGVGGAADETPPEAKEVDDAITDNTTPAGLTRDMCDGRFSTFLMQPKALGLVASRARRRNVKQKGAC